MLAFNIAQSFQCFLKQKKGTRRKGINTFHVNVPCICICFFVFTWFSLKPRTFQAHICRKETLVLVYKRRLFLIQFINVKKADKWFIIFYRAQLWSITIFEVSYQAVHGVKLFCFFWWYEEARCSIGTRKTTN